jgi:hypothetical protein
MKPLILMPCSAVKRPTVEPTRFIDLYDGPLWRQIRKHAYPADSVACLSAKHGLLMPGAKIEPYDQLMDEQRLLEIINDGNTVEQLAGLTEQAGLLLVIGSETYKFVGLALAAARPQLSGQVRFACGSYLEQRRALNQYLQPQLHRAAA